MSAGSRQSRARSALVLLAALFLVPLVLAFLTYYGTSWRPAGRVNHGHLYTPARPLPAVALPRISLEGASGATAAGAGATGPGATLEVPPPDDGPPGPGEERTPRPALRGLWSLVYVGDGGCDAPCQEALYVMRQTRLGLGRDMTRLERVFLVAGGCCAREFLARVHPGLVVLDAGGAAAQPLLHALTASDPPQGRPEGRLPGTAEAHTLYIVDPLGNLVMSYDASADPHGLLEDLKKLLRLSHIG
jgi:hypothetical protein